MCVKHEPMCPRCLRFNRCSMLARDLEEGKGQGAKGQGQGVTRSP